jgi:hypothetical protein
MKERQIRESSTIVFVRKKGIFGCVDSQQLSNITKDCFLLIIINMTLDMAAVTKWFSILDLKSSYWQTELCHI